MRIITDINHAADMLSASNWESYKVTLTLTLTLTLALTHT